MWSAITSLAEWLLGFLPFMKKGVDPTTAQLADSNARAQDTAQSEEATNVVVTEAAQARAAADTSSVLHAPGADQVESDPHAAINQNPDLHLRD